MSETTVDYHTDRDSGDETDPRREPGADAPPLPGTWVGRFDAAYWQTQAETAIRAFEQAQDTLARVEAERDATLAQLAALREQWVNAESRCTSLRTALNRANGLLSDERRAAAVQQRRSRLD
jgi:hypothetical protein